MKRTLLLSAVLVAAGLLPLVAAEGGTTYGQGVKLTTSVKVADLLAAPNQYLGKTVRVDGTVRAVCQEMGCWIQIADDQTSDGIQFKVDDGVIVFPKDAKGKRASAEGTFERIAAVDAHEGEHADPVMRAKEPGNEPEKALVASAPRFRIKATGAIIY
jgi:hypothetical protein